MSVFATDPWYAYWLGVLVGVVGTIVCAYFCARIS